MAWREVGPFSGIFNALPGNGYRQRWHIEQFLRTLKQQGLHLEDSQPEPAGRLLESTAIAARTACTTLQLVQRAMAGTGRTPGSPSCPPKSKPSTHSCPDPKARPRSKRTRIRRNRLPLPRGSSPSSADGTAIHIPDPQPDNLLPRPPILQIPRPADGGSELCEPPSADAGGRITQSDTPRAPDHLSLAGSPPPAFRPRNQSALA